MKSGVVLHHFSPLGVGYHLPMATGLAHGPRSWIAAVLIGMLTFASVLTAAHACALGGPGSPRAPMLDVRLDQSINLSPADQTMNGDCARPDPADNGGLCESHCVVGQQASGHAEAPLASVSQPPFRIDGVDRAERAVARPARLFYSLLSSIRATPPPLRRFARLLI